MTLSVKAIATATAGMSAVAISSPSGKKSGEATRAQCNEGALFSTILERTHLAADLIPIIIDYARPNEGEATALFLQNASKLFLKPTDQSLVHELVATWARYVFRVDLQQSIYTIINTDHARAEDISLLFEKLFGRALRDFPALSSFVEPYNARLVMNVKDAFNSSGNVNAKELKAEAQNPVALRIENLVGKRDNKFPYVVMNSGLWHLCEIDFNTNVAKITQLFNCRQCAVGNVLLSEDLVWPASLT